MGSEMCIRDRRQATKRPTDQSGPSVNTKDSPHTKEGQAYVSEMQYQTCCDVAFALMHCLHSRSSAAGREVRSASCARRMIFAAAAAPVSAATAAATAAAAVAAAVSALPGPAAGVSDQPVSCEVVSQLPLNRLERLEWNNISWYPHKKMVLIGYQNRIPGRFQAFTLCLRILEEEKCSNSFPCSARPNGPLGTRIRAVDWCWECYDICWRTMGVWVYMRWHEMA